MRDLAMRALDTARQRGAAYADVRVVRFKSESVVVRNKNVEALTSDESLGFGVRVIVDGYWGFAASHKMTHGRSRRASRPRRCASRRPLRSVRGPARRHRAAAVVERHVPHAGRDAIRSPSRSTTRSRCSCA